MPDLKISQLPVATTPLAGTELVPIVQGGTTDQTTVQAILTGTVPSGTANGVMFLNGSKVATTGSALTFDGTNLGVGTTSPTSGFRLDVQAIDAKQRIESTTGTNSVQQRLVNTGGTFYTAIDSSAGAAFGAAYSAVLWHSGNYPMLFATNNQERARITSGGNLLVGTTTENASGGVIQVSNGITFPATQSASTDANTLDDYEEGAWTPVLTFVTPGDLSVTYSTQVGRYTKIGNQVTVVCSIATSAFTHTTASGNLNITGLPFAAANITGYLVNGTCSAAGWTKTCEWLTPQIGSNTSAIYFQASTSGSSILNVTTADVPTATQQVWRVTLTYFV